MSLRSTTRNRLRSESRCGSSLRFEPLEERRMLSAAPQMLANVNQLTASSSPSRIVSLGEFALFIADDGIHGKELWRSDGTDLGTTLVADLAQGNFNTSELFVAGDRAFFGANTGFGQELWTSDGTADGTYMVADIAPGNSGFSPRDFAVSNDIIYFSATENMHGRELWRTDGTAEGTFLVADINAGSSNSAPESLIDVNGSLYFTATTAATGRELWKLTGNSVELVRDIAPGPDESGIGQLVDVVGTLYFAAHDGSGDSELWKSDGTEAGTVPVLATTPDWGSIRQLASFNGQLIVTTVDASQQSQIWITDGTNTNTRLLTSHAANFRSADFLQIGDTLYFTNSSWGPPNAYQLWATDGTPAGTTLLKEYQSPGSRIDHLTSFEGTLYFTAYDDVFGNELWQSNGMPEGTSLVKDLLPGRASSQTMTGTAPFAVVGDAMLFSASDADYQNELFASNGSAVGTRLVKDINQVELGSYPREFLDVDGAVFFTTSERLNPKAIWKTDGTPEGTELVLQSVESWEGGPFFPNYVGESIYYPIDLTVAGSSVVFLAFRGNDFGNLESWALWGIDKNTSQLVTEAELSRSNFFVFDFELEAVGDKVFLVADPDNPPLPIHQLWESDGSQAGTGPVIGPSGLVKYPSHLTNGLGYLFYITGEFIDAALYVTDGTADGTRELASTGLAKVTMSVYFAPNASIVYFTRWDPELSEVQLWRTDGTVVGTTLVKPLPWFGSHQYANGQLMPMMDVNGTLFFPFDSPQGKQALWKSDGTDAGTMVVKEDLPGNRVYDMADLTSVADVLFFTADDGVHGREVWRSDGTPAGTYMLADVNSTAAKASSNPSDLVNFDGRLYWSADDGIHGRELWTTDGTPEGTHQVVDLILGPQGSNPEALTTIGERLYYSADDGIHGPEPWFLEGSAPGDANDDGVVDYADYTKWADHFLQPGDWGFAQGDFNRDGIVDAGDYTLWADNYLDSPTQAAAVTALLESSAPASAAPVAAAAALPEARDASKSTLDSAARRTLAWAAAVDGYFGRRTESYFDPLGSIDEDGV